MGTPTDWHVQAFSAERATGTLVSPSTGRVATFPIEAWWPCDPAQARALQDDAERRAMLDPKPGEPVLVEWVVGRDVPRRVLRQVETAAAEPTFTFSEWFERFSGLVDLGPPLSEWQTVAGQVDGAALDAMRSSDRAAATNHLGLVAWVEGEAGVASIALPWLRRAHEPDCVAVAAGPLGTLFLGLSKDTLEALTAQGLIRLV